MSAPIRGRFPSDSRFGIEPDLSGAPATAHAFPLDAVERIVELREVRRLTGQATGTGVVTIDGQVTTALDAAHALATASPAPAQIVVVRVARRMPAQPRARTPPADRPGPGTARRAAPRPIRRRRRSSPATGSARPRAAPGGSRARRAASGARSATTRSAR